MVRPEHPVRPHGTRKPSRIWHSPFCSLGSLRSSRLPSQINGSDSPCTPIPSSSVLRFSCSTSKEHTDTDGMPFGNACRSAYTAPSWGHCGLLCSMDVSCSSVHDSTDNPEKELPNQASEAIPQPARTRASERFKVDVGKEVAQA